MRQSVLILGGYGNFGKRIAQALADDGIDVMIAGRNQAKADALVQQLPKGLAHSVCFDINTTFEGQLEALQPAVVINTCGPFQNSDYRVAETCIHHGIQYIDLADGRDFVTGITALHEQASNQGVTVISGASTVPGLSSAVIEHFRHEFESIETLKFGISPGQQAERGLATTQGILSYVGKPLKPFAGHRQQVYGWQDLYRQDYPTLGKRWMANCDIPDLDMLPDRYGIKSIQFSAGLELGFMHLGLWGLSWLVRLGIPLNLAAFASPLLRLSNFFNGMGTADGGIHMIVSGRDKNGNARTRSWFIIARDGHGPHIPTIPAIVLAKKLVRQEIKLSGAMPCVGLVSLDEYLQTLQHYHIQIYSYEEQCAAPQA